MARRESPDLAPLLSKGKHRTPRKGACFMEYASYLAGERWTDHPRCAHPLLAGVARAVNDQISDSGRPRLVTLIPSVIGLNGEDPRVDAGIAIRCAATALPVVAEQRQRALAAGLIAARRVVAELEAEETSTMDLSEVLCEADRALSRAPVAAQWATEFTTGTYLTPRALQSRSAPCMVRVAVIGISEACIPDPDEMLHGLLASVIDDCTRWLGTDSSVSPRGAGPGGETPISIRPETTGSARPS